MVPIRRLLMAGLVLISTGCLIGCSDNGSNQDSSLNPIVCGFNRSVRVSVHRTS